MKHALALSGRQKADINGKSRLNSTTLSNNFSNLFSSLIWKNCWPEQLYLLSQNLQPFATYNWQHIN